MNGPAKPPHPEYLRRWPGLWVRDGNTIVRANEQDAAVAQAYPDWSGKGALVRGQRLTILSARSSYRVNETVRIIHVFEVAEPGSDVYVMGPKPVHGEYVDDRLVTPPAMQGDASLRPLGYDGRVLTSPAVDYAFDMTAYAFPEPGLHRVVWRVDGMTSNELVIEVN